MLFTLNKIRELYTKDKHFLIVLERRSTPNISTTDTMDYTSMLASIDTKLGEIIALDFGEYLPSSHPSKNWRAKEFNGNLLFSKISKFENPIKVNILESPKEGKFIDLTCLGYDKKTDSVHFSFEGNKKKGLGIDLGKGIVIRIDPKTKEWLGVSIFGISKILKKSRRT